MGWEGTHARKSIKWLWIAGIFGCSEAAIAQTPPVSTAGTKFDGTYAFVSSTKLNENYMTGTTRIGQCSDRRVGPLTIINGQARYNYNHALDWKVEGTVGSQGELAMRLLAPIGSHKSFFEMYVNGRIVRYRRPRASGGPEPAPGLNRGPQARSPPPLGSRLRALLSGIFARKSLARQTNPVCWAKIVSPNMILRCAVPDLRSAFHQLLEPLDRRVIARAVAAHAGDRGVGSGERAWTGGRRLRGVLSAQWAGLTSLREIVAGLGAQSRRFCHLNRCHLNRCHLNRCHLNRCHLNRCSSRPACAVSRDTG